MQRRFFLALSLFAALATGSVQAQQQAQQTPLRISYVRSPFNLQLMVMKENGILQKHLTPLGLQAQWPEITSGAKQAQALASGDLDIGGVMNTASVLMANGEGNPVRIVAGVFAPHRCICRGRRQKRRAQSGRPQRQNHCRPQRHRTAPVAGSRPGA